MIILGADGYENQEVVDLSMQGFVTCNTDGQYGLTWDEIEACEVTNLNLRNQIDIWNSN